MATTDLMVREASGPPPYTTSYNRVPASNVGTGYIAPTRRQRLTLNVLVCSSCVPLESRICEKINGSHLTLDVVLIAWFMAVLKNLA